MRWLALIAVAYGCGDNLTGTPLTEFEDEARAARCARFVRCGLFVDDATCSTFFRKRPDLDLIAAVEAGIVRYDGASAKRCHEQLAALTCDETSQEVRTLPQFCEEMFVGSLAADDACVLDEECISGTCDRPLTCLDACCAGTCRRGRRFADVDEPCKRDDDCVEDAFCGDDEVCRPLAGVGELCRSDRQCKYHLGCIGATDLMAGNCREMPLIGEDCLYLRCAEIGARCQTGRCVPVGLVGTPCTSNGDCSPFSQCDTTVNTCIDTPLLGEPCTTRCGGEAWCDFMVTKTCAAPLENGSPCRSDDQCLSLTCNEGPFFDACSERPLCF